MKQQNIFANTCEWVLNHAKQHGGGTFNANGLPINTTTGYFVSVYGYEQRTKELTQNIIWNYIYKNIKHLLLNTNMFFGVWFDNKTNTWFLDVSKHVETLNEATIIATLNKQISVWDCANSVAIPTTVANRVATK